MTYKFELLGHTVSIRVLLSTAQLSTTDENLSINAAVFSRCLSLSYLGTTTELIENPEVDMYVQCLSLFLRG
jgi:hypothetical protein